MKMSEEMAVRLHRMMWSDMQKEIGDNPSGKERVEYKERWITKHFPGQDVLHRCFLCEYVQQMYSDKGSGICRNCPIVWPGDFCNGVIKSYTTMPISEILALPAKNESFDKKAVNIHDLSRDIVVGEVAKASGLPVECDIWSHIKAIQEKAVENDNAQKASIFNALAESSDLLKQYAEEKKKLIFMELAKESGLDPTATVKAHINAIYSNGFDNGKDAERERILDKIGEMLKK